jgi:hypothetical protein
MQKNHRNSILDNNNKVRLEINAAETDYIFISLHQKAGQTHNVRTASKCLEIVAEFEYLQVTVTNINYASYLKAG